MKTLHLYLTRQVLATLLMTVMVFTFVLLLGNVLKEILALMVNGQISLLLVLKAIGLLIPYVMAYVLPFGMLTAVVLVFGRFSADQELTAVRASGISLLSAITPVLLLSLLFCLVCALVNMWIAPLCRGAYKDLIFQLGNQITADLITEDRFIEEIPGIDFYVRKKDGDLLQDVLVYTLEKGEVTKFISANDGKVNWDNAARKISFSLTNGVIHAKRPVEIPIVYPPGFIGPIPPPKPPPASDWQVSNFGSFETDPIDLAPLSKGDRKQRLSEMNFFQLVEEITRLRRMGVPAMPAIVQAHRQLAFSFACFSFTLIGIPLAIQAHRRETSIGAAIALVLVMGYYSFFILGEALGTKERLRPYLFMWVANFIFQGLGALLLARANRRG